MSGNSAAMDALDKKMYNDLDAQTKMLELNISQIKKHQKQSETI